MHLLPAYHWTNTLLSRAALLLFSALLLLSFTASATHGHSSGLSIGQSTIPPVGNAGAPTHLLQTPEAGIFLAGDHAYLADGQNLRIFNIANPGQPVQIGFHTAGGGAQEVHVVGNIAYVSAEGAGLHILDVADPAQIGEIAVIAGTAWSAFVDGSYLYISSWRDNHRIYDISEPRAPRFVGALPTTNRALDVQVQGNIAYATDGQNKGLRVYDVTNPAAATQLDFAAINGTHERVEVHGEWAYLASGPAGFYIVRIGDPFNPSDTFAHGPYGFEHYAREIVVEGNMAYVAYQEGLVRVFDVTNPADPLELPHHQTPGAAMGLAVRDSMLYVADSSAGLVVLNAKSCYALQRTASGDGPLPVAEPTRSVDCTEGRYAPSEAITLRAAPVEGWAIHFWEGANENGAATSSLIMPPNDHEVHVAYRPSGEDDLLAQPLPGPNPHIGPPGVDNFVGEACCIAGYIYYDGAPVYAPTVTLHHGDDSLSAELYTRGSQRYFVFDLLDRDALPLAVGDSVTLEARAGPTLHHAVTYTLQPGTQQVDLVIPTADASGESNPPVATVSQRSHIGIVDVDDAMRFVGRGAVSAANATIVEYLWTSDLDGALGSEATLSLAPNRLSIGVHRIRFQVGDSNGQLSAPVSFSLEVRPSVDNWTLLLYLAGDYDDGNYLTNRFGEALEDIRDLTAEAGGIQEGVNVLVLSDGRGAGNATLRAFDSSGKRTLSGVCRALDDQREVATDRPETLTAFLDCGASLFPSTHYYLAIADHGHALYGTAWDYTSRTEDGQIPFLRTNEIDDAIRASAMEHVDVLHLDSCSMNLMEVAYELSDAADYLISSQFLTWADFAYVKSVQRLNAQTLPSALAREAAAAYAQSVPVGWPYTVSVLDLREAETVWSAVNQLGSDLSQAVQEDQLAPAALDSVRLATQVFESDYANRRIVHNPRSEFYIDLADWTHQLLAHPEAGVLPDVRSSALHLSSLLDVAHGFVVASHHRSGYMPDRLGGERIELERSSGISIFYPVENAESLFNLYRDGTLFSFVPNTPWVSFLSMGASLSAPGTPSTSVIPLPPLPPVQGAATPSTDSEDSLFLPLVAHP